MLGTIAVEGYDLIGDIHGHYEALIRLLKGMGYHSAQGVWRHPTRQVIFLGDFIDRGPQQREVLSLVRAMIEEGHALSVMGNHEYNAIAYFTADGMGGYLRPRSDKNNHQHRAFLEAFASNPAQWKQAIDWFKTLPLWLDLEPLRVIHACWDPGWIERLEQEYAGIQLTEALLVHSSQKGRWEFDAIETLLKGKELPLPAGQSFRDKDGIDRHQIRIRWWDNGASNYREAFMGPDSARSHIPDDPIPGDYRLLYGHHEKPIFLGHYWLEGIPSLLAPNIACLDYSVAKPGGKLVAYRWSGESVLDSRHFFHV